MDTSRRHLLEQVPTDMSINDQQAIMEAHFMVVNMPVTSEGEPDDETNMGLIVGLSVGLPLAGVLVLVGAFGYYCGVVKKKAQQEKYQPVGINLDPIETKQ